MKITTALNHKSRFLNTVKSIFSTARMCGDSHAKICHVFQESISESEAYRRCPEWVHRYITGYRDAMFDTIHRDLVTWHVWCDGAHVLGKDVPDGRWCEVVADQGAFLWNHDTTKVFIGYDPTTQADVSDHTAETVS